MEPGRAIGREISGGERAEKELEAFISRRASRDKRPDSDELEPAYRESVRRHNAKIRERNRWEWVRFFDRMAASHARLSESYRERAEKLLEGDA